MCWSITKIQFCCQQKVHLQRKPTFLFYGIILCSSPIFSAGCNNLMQPYHAVCKFCKSQFRSVCPSHNNQFNAYLYIFKLLLVGHTVLNILNRAHHVTYIPRKEEEFLYSINRNSFQTI